MNKVTTVIERANGCMPPYVGDTVLAPDEGQAVVTFVGSPCPLGDGQMLGWPVEVIEVEPTGGSGQAGNWRVGQVVDIDGRPAVITGIGVEQDVGGFEVPTASWRHLRVWRHIRV